jgi:hypothetical protein
MPLLFFIAGAAVWFSLGKRTGKQYLVERLGRLFVPLIFGMLVLNSAVQYISVLFHNQLSLYHNSFLIWFRTYLTTMLFPWQKNWAPGTIWFVWYLLIYSIILLPLLVLLRRRVDGAVWIKIGEYFQKRGSPLHLFLFAIIPIIVQFYPPPNAHSVFQISYFVFFFLFGFFIYSSPQMQAFISKYGLFSLIIGIISVILIMFLIFPAPLGSFLGSDYWRALGSQPGKLGQDLYLILRGISCWFTIIGLIYLARKFLDFNNRFLRYANEIVLPFYLIHATYIALIGYYTIPLHLNILSKFVIIVFSSLAATLVTIELCRRFNITRFLLGMRLQKKPAGQI